MSWMTDIADPAAARDRALKTLTIPLGLANPLWLPFCAAASAGAAWWLLTRLAKPLNAEAMAFVGAAPAKTAAPAAIEAPAEGGRAGGRSKTPETGRSSPEVALVGRPPRRRRSRSFAGASPCTGARDRCRRALEAPVEAVLEAVQAAVETQAEVAAEVVAEAEASDDLTLLVGIGPRTAAALAERGVTRFAHLAAWTDDQVAAFDAEMQLKGRSTRDAWRAQAQTPRRGSLSRGTAAHRASLAKGSVEMGRVLPRSTTESAIRSSGIQRPPHAAASPRRTRLAPLRTGG